MLHNVNMFNGWDADVILVHEKVAVLWNGEWHFTKLKQRHSVLQVQTRDQIKVSEILAAGYTPYIIEDRFVGKKHEKEKFVVKEFLLFKEFIENLKMGPVGLEPTTCGLKGRCSTN